MQNLRNIKQGTYKDIVKKSKNTSIYMQILLQFLWRFVEMELEESRKSHERELFIRYKIP